MELFAAITYHSARGFNYPYIHILSEDEDVIKDYIKTWKAGNKHHTIQLKKIKTGQKLNYLISQVIY